MGICGGVRLFHRMEYLLRNQKSIDKFCQYIAMAAKLGVSNRVFSLKKDKREVLMPGPVVCI